MAINRGGAALLGISIVSAGILAVPRFIGVDGSSGDTIYDRSRWVIVGLIAVAALVVSLAPARCQGSGYGVGFAAAAQIAGTGVVAVKHWRPWIFCCGGYYESANTLVALAAALAVLGAAATVICLDGLRRSAVIDRTQPTRIRAAFITTATAIAVGLPWLFAGSDHENLDHTSLLGYAALASVPFALCFGLAAYVDRHTSVAVLGAVAVSAIASWASRDPMRFQFTHSDLPFALVVGIAANAATWRSLRVSTS